MGKADYYYAVEKRDGKITSLHKINVGIRHIGLNAQVRSMLAFGQAESTRLPPVSFRVLSSGQYVAALEQPYSDVRLFIDEHVAVHGNSFYMHDSPREFYAHIGYDRVKKTRNQSN